VLGAIARAIRDRGTFELEHRVRRVDGSVGWTFSRAVPIFDERGEVAEWFGAASDVTARKEAEGTLRASATVLKEADRRKDEFLAMLAHELRNPLAPISNSLHTLRLSSDPAVARQAQEVMDRQVRHLVRLVDDLLDVSRITRGKVALRKEAVSLSAVIGAALETVIPMVEQRGQTLRVTLPEDVWLDADKARLAQVFANILHNASKFTHPHGAIVLTGRLEANGVSVEIRDNGVGIPPAQLGSIFDLFSQVDNSLERSQGGLGIGLTIVRSLLELHGGRVDAASDGPAKGAAFRVYLPTRAESAPAAVRSAPAARSAAAPLRLLVVDDNRDSARTLGSILQLLGHEVQLEYDGEAALAAAARFRPDAVFLDIGMPGMSGYEVCHRLKVGAPAGGPVVIAQTGWGDPAQRARAQEAGFDHHLVKPLDAETVKDLLARIVPGAPAFAGETSSDLP
jgi:signal transduction histidine kinase/CheY-like chemotaxis protein